MRAELFVDPVLVALVEQVELLGAKRRQEGIGIEKAPGAAPGLVGPQLVLEDLGDAYLPSR